MAADSQADDKDPDADTDPWADIIADGLSADDDAAAFDFSSLDEPEPASAALNLTPPSTTEDAPEDDAENLFGEDTDDVTVAAVTDEALTDEATADDVLAGLMAGDEGDAGDVFETAVSGSSATDEALDSTADPEDVAEPSVFQGDDSPTEGSRPSSTVEIGTGFSGLDLGGGSASDDEGDTGVDDGFTDAFAEPFSGDADDATADTDAADPLLADFGEAAIVTATAGATVAADRPPRRSAARSKKGGVGQMLGIILGGALSLPIVGLILIGAMWLGGPDSLGMRRWLPGASFLLPPRKAAPGGGGQAKSLDDLSASGGSQPAPADVDTPPPDAFAVATAAVDADVPDPEPQAAAIPVDIADPVAAEPPMVADPLAALPVPEVDVAVAAPDLLAALPSVPPLDADLLQPSMPAREPDAGPGIVPPPAPEPAPEPLDTAPLDAAVDAAIDAAGRLADENEDADRERPRRLVDWYRALATIGEELTALEAVAGARGVPFVEVAPRLDPLLGDLTPDGPLAADLSRLARNWLTFSRRDRDGVVLPVTFASMRQIGPYWCSTVRLAEADGSSRDIAVITRRRPTAAPDSRCVVLGVVFDGGVVWAADLRGEDGRVVLESEGEVDALSSEASGGEASR